MSRAVSNLLIVLVMTATATAVLAFSSNTADIAEPGDHAAAPGTPDDNAADETFGEHAVDALQDAGGATASTETTPPAASGSTESTDDGAAGETATSSDEATAGDDDTTDVLGAAQAQPAQTQETSPSEALAETGPVEVGQWLVVAAAIIATGGLARNAGRDHREGFLTVLP